MNINVIKLFLYILFLLIILLWYFGRHHPIILRDETTSSSVTCRECYGSKTVNCLTCGGFGSVDTFIPCDKCQGTGKHQYVLSSGLNAPCMKCRGSGTLSTRHTCKTCNGSGKRMCNNCEGTGMISSSIKKRVVYLDYSLWERFLLLLKVDPDPNPRPLPNSYGAYPIVEKYIELKSPTTPCSVTNWGRFYLRGNDWIVTASVVFATSDTSNQVRHMEFVVRNRKMIGSRYLR